MPTDDSQPPRALSRREREILDFLLAVEGQGVEELRRQGREVLARPWGCGCASIHLVVDHASAPASSIRTSPAIETTTKERDDPEKVFTLLVWMNDGFLSSIEIVDYGEAHGEHSGVFPPTTDFELPRLRSAPATVQ